MGLFGAIKAFFALKKNLAKEIEAIKEREARYPAMTTDELAALDDEELFEAVNVRTENKVDNFEELTDGFNALNTSQKVFYALKWLEMEVTNGGLCQFFVNSSREAAPYVSECLAAVGAEKHRALFDEFVQNNAIDLSDLSSFMIFWSKRSYIKQTKRYDFDAFDNQYYELPALQELITAYIRANIAEF